MLAIRLTRLGAKKRPFYRVVVAEKRSKRDGRFIENVGYYNPIAQGQQLDLVLKLDRIDYWIQHGAQPTDTVRSLIKRKKAMDRKNPPAVSL